MNCYVTTKTREHTLINFHPYGDSPIDENIIRTVKFLFWENDITLIQLKNSMRARSRMRLEVKDLLWGAWNTCFLSRSQWHLSLGIWVNMTDTYFRTLTSHMENWLEGHRKVFLEPKLLFMSTSTPRRWPEGTMTRFISQISQISLNLECWKFMQLYNFVL